MALREEGGTLLLGAALLVMTGGALVWARFQLFNRRLQQEREERHLVETELRETTHFLRGELETRERNLETLARTLAERNRDLQKALDSAQAAKERAEEGSRAKSRFLAAVSHELRAPLTSILGNAELLARSGEDDAPHVQLEAIRSSAIGLATLIDEILAIAGSSPFDRKVRQAPVDVTAEARTVVDDHRLRARERGVRLELEAPEAPLVVESDAARIRQALQQLVENALEYTETGSVVVRILRDSAQVRMEVEDTGPGIPEEERQRIFEPFFRLGEPHTGRNGGAGVGLALARGCARSIGGDVEWHPRPGGGSTFTLSIPHPDAPTSRCGAESLERCRILVVDDDVPVRTVVVRALRREGAVVDETEGAEEALDRLTGEPGYDLVVSDISMPGRTGISLATEIRARWPALPVLLISGAELDDTEAGSAREVADGFLRKPFAVDVLVTAVQDARRTGAGA